MNGIKADTPKPPSSSLANGSASSQLRLAVSHVVGASPVRAPPPLKVGVSSTAIKRVPGGAVPPLPALTPATGISTTATVCTVPSVRSTIAQTINVSQLSSQQQVSGHVLTLPPSIQGRVNVNNSLSIRVNNQNIVVPPSCLISTPMGIKVFLPPGIVSTAMDMSGQDSARGATVYTNASNPQKLSVKQQGEVILANTPPPSMTSKPATFVIPKVTTLDKTKVKVSKKKLTGINPAECFVSQLHGGFDCMLRIFQYLKVADLLRYAITIVWFFLLLFITFLGLQ